ncbi:nucleoside-specific channel-forming Tsx family protein [Spongorhabdus nitratireducens]
MHNTTHRSCRRQGLLSGTSLLIVLFFLSLGNIPVRAADYADGDIHKNDYKWYQFNLMQSLNNKLPFGARHDTYFEMEFGGRSGILSLYGYIDVFDIFDRRSDDRHNKDNFFMKFAPRLSLDGMTGKDLSFGPVKEVYISGLANVGDSGQFGGLFDTFIGLGVDVEVPWFGIMGSNIMARYSRENFKAPDEGKWSGYIWTNNWFKPFWFFENQTFIAYQGYLDYKFGYDKLRKVAGRTSHSLEWFHGFYWHSDQWSVGYGLKYYNSMANFKDDSPYTVTEKGQKVTKKQETTGFGHYFAIIYKF